MILMHFACRTTPFIEEVNGYVTLSDGNQWFCLNTHTFQGHPDLCFSQAVKAVSHFMTFVFSVFRSLLEGGGLLRFEPVLGGPSDF